MVNLLLQANKRMMNQQNKTTSIASLVIIIFIGLGCGSINPFSSKESGSGTSGDSTVGFERVGIPECDAVIDELAQLSVSEDEGYVAKAIRGYWVDKIRESLRKSVEENQGDPEKLAAECRNFKAQLDRHRAEENEKKQ
jgi:hypothetical protein